MERLLGGRAAGARAAEAVLFDGGRYDGGGGGGGGGGGEEEEEEEEEEAWAVEARMPPSMAAARRPGSAIGIGSAAGAGAGAGADASVGVGPLGAAVWAGDALATRALERAAAYVASLCHVSAHTTTTTTSAVVAAASATYPAVDAAAAGAGAAEERVLQAWHVWSVNEYRVRQPRILVLSSRAYYRVRVEGSEARGERVRGCSRIALADVMAVRYDLNLGCVQGASKRAAVLTD